jgi:hypothetical protein
MDVLKEGQIGGYCRWATKVTDMITCNNRL